MEEIISRFDVFKIIPVIAIERLENVLPLADALIKGDLPLMEITYRTNIAAKAVLKIRKECPEILIGAGTVLTIDELHSAIDSGASFAVAPGLNRIILEEAIKRNFPFFPGIMTPSELEAALALGVHVYKFFPAEAAGGIKFLKSIVAAYAHKKVQFLPTGGINTDNLKSYLAMDEVLAVGGTWITKKPDIEKQNWAGITENCLKVRTLINSYSGNNSK